MQPTTDFSDYCRALKEAEERRHAAELILGQAVENARDGTVIEVIQGGMRFIYEKKRKGACEWTQTAYWLHGKPGVYGRMSHKVVEDLMSLGNTSVIFTYPEAQP